MVTTKLSSKGQVIIPKSVRDARHWRSGTELVVEVKPDGVMLKPVARVTKTKVSDVIGCLKYRGPIISDRKIKSAIDAIFRKTWKP